MILADTSIWIKFLSHENSTMKSLLETEKIVMHPFVQVEISLGSLKNRNELMRMMDRMPHTDVVDNNLVKQYIENNKLYNTGIGFVDASIIASCVLNSHRLWTLDKALIKQAAKCKILYSP